MLDKFDFFKIQQEDVDKKLSSLVLTTAISVAGLVVLAVVSALLVDDEDEESDKDDSDE